MEQKRAQAVRKLGELKMIQPTKYSARDLHSNRPMLSRVQRQEHRRYAEKVKAQKLKLKKDIFNIDKYLQSVDKYEKYLVKKAEFEANLPTQDPLEPIKKVSVFTTPEPIRLPTPSIVFGRRPILKKTRLHGYKRRGR